MAILINVVLSKNRQRANTVTLLIFTSCLSGPVHVDYNCSQGFRVLRRWYRFRGIASSVGEEFIIRAHETCTEIRIKCRRPAKE